MKKQSKRYGSDIISMYDLQIQFHYRILQYRQR